MLLVGILSALGLLILALKAGGRKTIGHDIFVDVLITVTLMVCFYGTFSGMTAAMMGGLTASSLCSEENYAARKANHRKRGTGRDDYTCSN